MTSQLSDNVVLQISKPPTVTTESEGVGGGGGGGGGRGGGGSLELGRRLLAAARLGHTALVLDLMAKGAPFTTDWLGTSPLHLAAGGAHTDTCAVLLRAGVSRDSRTKVERTPLHLAAHAGHAAVVALLLANGAAPDPRDMLRMTPLHWACERGHAAAAAVLLRHGADARAASKFGKTPRSLAAARGHADIVALIDEALRDREAVNSVDALREADEQMTYEVEIPAAEQQRALESIEKPDAEKPAADHKTVRTEPIKIHIEKPPAESGGGREGGAGGGGADGGGGAGAGGGAAQAAALLRAHGITLLPHDSSSTVLNAIHSGRTVVLSDAGKLMLKESGAPAPAPAAAPTPTPAPSKGVILRAAPARAPPAPGVKIFTLNNKLVALADRAAASTDLQVKLVAPPARPALKPRPRGAPPSLRSPVKIIMHKGGPGKILKARPPENGLEAAGAGVAGAGAGADALRVPAEFLSSTSAAYLRAQLLAAHRTIHALRADLAALRHRLARRGPSAT